MQTNTITVEATISASVQKVWDCYTKPEHITKWNFAADSWTCPRASNELKAGGKYFARMEAKDGSVGFDFEAIYDEVVIGQKLSYTMGDGRKAAVSFEKSGSQTHVSVTFEAESTNSLELQKNGWQAILNNFKKYTELG